MNLSLNEAQALAKKAAKGAGINWGAAHETGRAVRWLLEQGIDPFPVCWQPWTHILAGQRPSWHLNG